MRAAPSTSSGGNGNVNFLEYWPSDADHQPLTRELFHEHTRMNATCFIMFISYRRMARAGRTLADYRHKSEDLGGYHQYSLFLLLLSQGWRLGPSSPGKPKYLMTLETIYSQVGNHPEGAYLRFYENPKPERRAGDPHPDDFLDGEEEMPQAAPAPAARKAPKLGPASMTFPQYLQYFFRTSKPLPFFPQGERQNKELAAIYERWQPLFDIQTPEQFRVAASWYLGREVPTSLELSELFGVRAAVEAKTRFAGSMVDTWTNPFRHRHLSVDEECERMFIDGLLFANDPAKTVRISRRLSNISVMKHVMMPHIEKPPPDMDSPGYREFRASRPDLSDEEVCRLYQTTLTLYNTSDTELSTFIHSCQARLRRFRKAKDWAGLQQARSQILKQWNLFWNNQNFAEGAFSHIVRFMNDLLDLPTSPFPSFDYEHTNVDVSGSFLLRNVELITLYKKIGTCQKQIIFHNLLVHDSTYFLRDHRLAVMQSGPPGTSKSEALKISSRMCIKGTVVMTQYTSMLAETGQHDVVGLTQFFDEYSVDDLGGNPAAATLEGQIGIALGTISASDTTAAASRRKMSTQTTTKTTRALVYDQGLRRTVQHESMDVQNQSGNMNHPTIGFSNSILDRYIRFFIAVVAGAKNMDKEIASIQRSGRYETERIERSQQLDREWHIYHGFTSTIHFMCCLGVLAHVQMDLIEHMFEVFRRLLSSNGVPSAGGSRTSMNLKETARTLSVWRAITRTYGMGIGGPDPSRPFRYTDFEYVQEALIGVPCIAYHVMELLSDSLIDPIEIDIVCALRAIIELRKTEASIATESKSRADALSAEEEKKRMEAMRTNYERNQERKLTAARQRSAEEKVTAVAHQLGVAAPPITSPIAPPTRFASVQEADEKLGAWMVTEDASKTFIQCNGLLKAGSSLKYRIVQLVTIVQPYLYKEWSFEHVTAACCNLMRKRYPIVVGNIKQRVSALDFSVPGCLRVYGRVLKEASFDKLFNLMCHQFGPMRHPYDYDLLVRGRFHDEDAQFVCATMDMSAEVAAMPVTRIEHVSNVDYVPEHHLSALRAHSGLSSAELAQIQREKKTMSAFKSREASVAEHLVRLNVKDVYNHYSMPVHEREMDRVYAEYVRTATELQKASDRLHVSYQAAEANPTIQTNEEAQTYAVRFGDAVAEFSFALAYRYWRLLKHGGLREPLRVQRIATDIENRRLWYLIGMDAPLFEYVNRVHLQKDVEPRRITTLTDDEIAANAEYAEQERLLDAVIVRASVGFDNYDKHCKAETDREACEEAEIKRAVASVDSRPHKRSSLRDHIRRHKRRRHKSAGSDFDSAVLQAVQ